jgi:hypothetical protein
MGFVASSLARTSCGTLERPVTGATWKTTGKPDEVDRPHAWVGKDTREQVKRAILSVSDKTGLEVFARGLIER